jgi:hypothetical protein
MCPAPLEKGERAAPGLLTNTVLDSQGKRVIIIFGGHARILYAGSSRLPLEDGIPASSRGCFPKFYTAWARAAKDFDGLDTRK